MNCLEVRYRIMRFLFGELSLVELAELRAHMETCKGCGDCQVEKEAIEMLLAQLTSSVVREPVPEGLRQRIFARLAQDEDVEG
jgi:anti-sigma factor RsiW